MFKDPVTAAAVLYVNQADKAALETIITEAGITGAAFVELGPPPKKPRPRFLAEHRNPPDWRRNG